MSEPNVWLQPIVALEPGRPVPAVVGCEASLRAGATLDGDDLGACREILDAVGRQPTSGKLLLRDLPERTFRSGLGSRFRDLVRRYGIHETNVVLVLPDTLSGWEPIESDRVAADLRDQGFGLAIGGFGCRAGDLSLLERLPVDVLKVDARFASQVHRCRRKQAIVKSVLELGKELQLQVVLEGVSTLDELDAVYRLGATYVQGAAFSPPVTAARFAAAADSIREMRLDRRKGLEAPPKRTAVLLDRESAHELANLVAGMALLAEQMFDSIPEDNPLREDLKLISNAGVRAAELTQRLQEAVALPEPVAAESEFDALEPPRTASEIN